MDRNTVLQFLRAHAAGLRLQATGYATSSKVRAGLVAQAVSLEEYAAAVDAMPPPDPNKPSSVLLLLI